MRQPESANAMRTQNGKLAKVVDDNSPRGTAVFIVQTNTIAKSIAEEVLTEPRQQKSRNYFKNAKIQKYFSGQNI